MVMDVSENDFDGVVSWERRLSRQGFIEDCAEGV
jgi:hypothetical protein